MAENFGLWYTTAEKSTVNLYIFNRVRVLHLNRLKERTWLHSFGIFSQGPLKIWTEHSPNLVFWNFNLGRISEQHFWITLKSSHQKLCNKGSNFIFNPLEVGYCAPKTLTFFNKLRMLAFYNNIRIRQASEFATFWHYSYLWHA